MPKATARTERDNLTPPHWLNAKKRNGRRLTQGCRVRDNGAMVCAQSAPASPSTHASALPVPPRCRR
jgi:hypothetical protein